MIIDIKKFIQIRKAQKLSQTDLCHGICTQSTLSKFENNGQMLPSEFSISYAIVCTLKLATLLTVVMSTNHELLFDADFAFIKL